MSALNGDKSRFNRERKQKIARRKRTRAMLHPATAKNKPADTHSNAQSKAVQA